MQWYSWVFSISSIFQLQNEAFERQEAIDKGRGPGRIMGPEIKGEEDGHVEGPLGLDQNEGQGQVGRPDIQEPMQDGDQAAPDQVNDL